MAEIREYDIIATEMRVRGDWEIIIQELKKDVNVAIKNDWQPYGDTQVIVVGEYIRLFQTVIK